MTKPLGSIAVSEVVDEKSGVVLLSGDGAAVVTSIAASNQVDGAGAEAGTLLNAPVVGNPAFWVPITVNGVVRHFPVW